MSPATSAWTSSGRHSATKKYVRSLPKQRPRTGHRAGGWAELGPRVDQCYSALAPENLTTLAHFSVSSTINAPNSVGVIGIGSAPRPLIGALSCGQLERTATDRILMPDRR